MAFSAPAASISSEPSTQNAVNDEPPTRLTRVPVWIPLAAFTGTSVVLALPLLYIARQRRTVLRKALSSAPPPPQRRIISSSRDGQKLTLPPLPRLQEEVSFKDPSPSEFASPGTRELLSAIAKVDYATAIFAGKAFAIATGIVATTGAVFTFGVKSWLGVRDTQDFADRMRSFVWSRLPGLTSQIHRPLDPVMDSISIASAHLDEEEIHFLREAEGELDNPNVRDEDWTWDEAEKRLQVAYDSGGMRAWVKAAVQEMRAEAVLERARRGRVQNESTSLKDDSHRRKG